MKKANNILFALAAAILMVACTKVEHESFMPAEDIDITFQVGNYAVATKAGEAEYTGAPFGTIAVFTPGAFEATKGNATRYMDKVEVVKNGNVWQPTSTYRWPKAGMLSFASYSPYSNGANSAVSVDSENNIIFTGYAAGSEDLMYSDPVLDQSANEKNYYGHGFNGVPTLFHHALTWVEFNFKTSDSDSANWIEIESADVNNCTSKGNFSALTKTWTASETSEQSVYGNGHAQYFIPQSIASMKLTVRGSIKNKVRCEDGNTEVISTAFERSVNLADAITAWTIGKHIIYNVDVKIAEKLIIFDADTKDWVSTQAITLQ